MYWVYMFILYNTKYLDGIPQIKSFCLQRLSFGLVKKNICKTIVSSSLKVTNAYERYARVE